MQSGSNASVFSTLDAAVAAASAGDYIYLSGGQFTLGGIAGVGGDSINFYKPLHFIGAGINADSTSVTGQTFLHAPLDGANLSGDMSIGSAAGGSTFDGISFNCPNLFLGNGSVTPDSSGHFTFTRCMMNAFNFYGRGGGPSPGSVSAEFHECILTGGLWGSGAGTSAATVDKCIIMSLAQAGSQAVSFTNCVLAAAPGSGSITNCIIYAGNNSFANQFGAVYTNCILGDALPGSGSDVFNNCTGGVTMSTVFVNAATAGFAWANDYHLAVGSPAIGYGNDGHDCGVFGSATPSKPGWVPYNPHFTGATIPGSTDANGSLNINIHVAAQPY
ncbi:MAG: hypothetical protein JWO06_3764 [Bacteroidota bacterium]|nr:hypothetical protein [Bacteroidota bacterium]